MSKKTPTHSLKDALFREAVKDVSPLDNSRAAPYRNRLPPRPLPRHQGHPADPSRHLDIPLHEQDIATGEVLYFARPGIQHRLMKDLGRGRIEIQESLDLHGLTIRYAYLELMRFLEFCRRHRIRCVRIIHGKGYGSENRQPVLKQRVNFWLQQREDVLGFCSAHRRDGGTGAVYVLLSGHRRR